MYNKTFYFLLILIYSCSNETISKEDTSNNIGQLEEVVNEDALDLLGVAYSYSNIVLNKIGIENENKNKFLIDSFLDNSELIDFRGDVTKMNFLFGDTTDINFMIEQSEVIHNSIINVKIFDKYLDKEEYKLIKNKESTSLNNDDIIYKISYPFYTKSKQSAIVITKCKIGKSIRNWASILSFNNDKWEIKLVLGLDDDGFILDFSKEK